MLEAETGTLGLRQWSVDKFELERHVDEVDVEATSCGSRSGATARRPNTTTSCELPTPRAARSAMWPGTRSTSGPVAANRASAHTTTDRTGDLAESDVGYGAGLEYIEVSPGSDGPDAVTRESTTANP